MYLLTKLQLIYNFLENYEKRNKTKNYQNGSKHWYNGYQQQKKLLTETSLFWQYIHANIQ